MGSLFRDLFESSAGSLSTSHREDITLVTGDAAAGTVIAAIVDLDDEQSSGDGSRAVTRRGTITIMDASLDSRGYRERIDRRARCIINSEEWSIVGVVEGDAATPWRTFRVERVEAITSAARREA